MPTSDHIRQADESLQLSLQKHRTRDFHETVLLNQHAVDFSL